MLTLAGGAGFWFANLAISRTHLAAEYRNALSIRYGPMLLASLVGGLIIGLCVSSLLLRLSRRAPARNPVRSAILLSLGVLAIVTVALDVPAGLLTGTEVAVRYFLIGLLFNAVRILALGAVIGHLQAWLSRRRAPLAGAPSSRQNPGGGSEHSASMGPALRAAHDQDT